MYLRNQLLFLALFFIVSVNAQNHPTCNGTRYIEDIFSEVEITTGVNFGSATTISGNFKELDMDIYEPSGDTAENRPVIILAFGGSFITGQRQDLDFLCRAYARKGYVAATIDYRLYDGSLLPLPSAETMQDVVTKAVADFKAAIRFFREDADGDDLFRVDPNIIFTGGISAGAIAAAHASVMDETDTYTDELADIIDANGGLEGASSDNLQYSSEVQGYVNYSGGLGDADWIDANDPPFFSIHDDMDGTVPYGGGFATVFGFDIIYMEGSEIMHEVAADMNINNKLITIEESNGHVSYMISQTDQMASVDSSAVFLEDLICQQIISTDTEELGGALAVLNVFPNPTKGNVYLEGAESSILQLTLRDILGNELQYIENTRTINLSGYPSGIYFLEIEDSITKERLIKRLQVKE